MQAIPLNVLVAAHQALDRVMKDPAVPGNVKVAISFTVGSLGYYVNVLLEEKMVEVSTPEAIAKVAT